MTTDFVWRMEDVLDLYAEPTDPTRPRACVDERPCRLTGEVVEPLPVKPDEMRRPTPAQRGYHDGTPKRERA